MEVESGQARTGRRYSEAFRRQMVDAAQRPGASVAALAKTHGLDASSIRRWVKAVGQASTLDPKVAAVDAKPRRMSLVPVRVEAHGDPHIRVEIQRSATTIQMSWPSGESHRLESLIWGLWK